MTTQDKDIFPDIQPDGVLTFSSLAVAQAALPKLRRGAFTCVGQAPPVGEASFLLRVTGTSLEARVDGKIILAAAGKAMVLFKGSPQAFIQAVEQGVAAPETKPPLAAGVGPEDASTVAADGAVALPAPRKRVLDKDSTHVGRGGQVVERVGGTLAKVAVPAARVLDSGDVWAAAFHADLPADDVAKAAPLAADHPLRSGVALGPGGTAGIFLECGKLHCSGDLEFTKDAVTKVASLVAGHLVALRSNDPTETLGEFLLASGVLAGPDLERALEEAKTLGVPLGMAMLRLGLLTDAELAFHLARQVRTRLGNLLTWSHGTARFKDAPEVAQPAKTLPRSSLEYCREFTAPARGFSALRVRDLLGPTNAVQVRPQDAWRVPQSSLSQEELRVLGTIKADESLAGLLERLEKDGMASGAAAHALFMLAAAGVVESGVALAASTNSAAKPAGLAELEDRLAEHDVFRMLGLHVNTPPMQLLEAVDQLASTVMALSKDLPGDDPTSLRLTSRVGELFRRLSDPVELRVMMRAHVLGLDPYDPATHEQLKAHSVLDAAEAALEQGDVKEALPLARRAAQALPDEPLALAVLQRCVALNSPQSDTLSKAIQELRNGVTRFPESAALQLALAELCALQGNNVGAKAALKRAEKLGASVKVLKQLKNHLAKRMPTSKVRARPERSRAWLWLVAAVVLAGGAVVAALEWL